MADLAEHYQLYHRDAYGYPATARQLNRNTDTLNAATHRLKAAVEDELRLLLACAITDVPEWMVMGAPDHATYVRWMRKELYQQTR